MSVFTWGGGPWSSKQMSASALLHVEHYANESWFPVSSYSNTCGTHDNKSCKHLHVVLKCYTCTPVHLIVSVETVDCVWDGVLHLGVNIVDLFCTRFVMTPASGIKLLKRNRTLLYLPLSCTDFNLYWLNQVNRSIMNYCKQLWFITMNTRLWFTPVLTDMWNVIRW